MVKDNNGKKNAAWHSCKYSFKKSFAQYIFAIILVGIYIFDWFFFKSTYHSENTEDIVNFLSGISKGDILGTVFNLDTIEHGCYRPRAGAFLIQYLDILLWTKLNRWIHWGGHYPFILLGIPLTITGGVFDT